MYVQLLTFLTLYNVPSFYLKQRPQPKPLLRTAAGFSLRNVVLCKKDGTMDNVLEVNNRHELKKYDLPVFLFLILSVYDLFAS